MTAEFDALSPAFCADFEKILDKRFRLSPNEVFYSCMDVLKAHSVCKYEDSLAPTLFLCHWVNRGTLMLNPKRMHGNGKKIHLGGADLSQLVNSYCIELALSGEHRKLNLQKNADLVKRAKGLIAVINLTERYLSLGCGHTVGFSKAAMSGTKTSEKDIADRDGNIDLALLCRNAVFKIMLTKGWGWWVIPAIVDIKYPAFARIAQKALNVANQIAQEIGDLEVGMTIPEYLADKAISTDDEWKDIVTNLVRDSGANCLGWTDSIIKFVQSYSGGPGAPLMKFIHNVAQQYQCTHSLGPVLWNAISNCVFYDRVDEHNLLRVAMMLLALSADKEQGSPFPTILRPSDITKVASKASAPNAKLYEKTLKDALAIAEICRSNMAGVPVGTCAETDGNEISAFVGELGQLFVRVGGLATNKGAQGLEGVQRPLPEIKAMFLAQMSEAVGKPIKFPSWGDVATVAEKKVPAASAAIACASTSLEDHNDPKFILRRNGIVKGVMMVERDVGSPASIDRAFIVVAIKGDKLSLKQASPFLENPIETTISVDDALTKWTLFKCEIPKKVHVGHLTPSLLTKIEPMRIKLWQALMAAQVRNLITQSLQFWRKPDSVRAGKDFKKGELVLFPIAPYSHIGIVGSAATISLGKQEIAGLADVEFFLQPLSKPSPDKEGNYSEKAIWQAYWWIGVSHRQQDANMELCNEDSKGFSFPCYKNNVAVMSGQPLTTYVAPPVRTSIVPKAKGAKAQRKS